MSQCLWISALTSNTLLSTAAAGGYTWWDASGATLHYGVVCDVCHANPIAGVRYKSVTRPSYDLCARCRLLPDAEAEGPYVALGSPTAAELDGGAEPAGHRQGAPDGASP